MGKPGIRIGIATTLQPTIAASAQGRRPVLHFCRMAQRAAELGADTVLFNPKDVDWSTKTVMAWTPSNASHPLGAWVQRRMGLPDVVYENVFVHLAVAGYTTALRQHCRSHRIPLFNPALFNKWRMITWMKSHKLDKYAPETLRPRLVEEAMAGIDRWRMAYVKPVGGYGGMGVARIERLQGGGYRLSLDRQNGKTQRIRRNLSRSELSQWLRSRLKSPHLVQQGIHLLSIGGRKVDFRVVTQRDGHGEWVVVGIIPKLAAADGVVSNIVAGGERLSLEQFQGLAKREGKRIPVESMEQCALKVSRGLSAYQPYTGLLGFDVGVDEGGHVYVIEMNPKPARSLLDAAMKKKLATYQAEFAVYLARRARA